MKFSIHLYSLLLAGCLGPHALHPQAERQNQLAVENLQAGALSRAETHLKVALEYGECYAGALHNLALVALERGDLERAEKHELEALACRPDLVQAVNGLGVIARIQGRIDRARELFEDALRLDPAYLDARRNLLLAHIEEGEYALAAEQLRRLLALAPGDAWAEGARQWLWGIYREEKEENDAEGHRQ